MDDEIENELRRQAHELRIALDDAREELNKWRSHATELERQTKRMKACGMELRSENTLLRTVLRVVINDMKTERAHLDMPLLRQQADKKIAELEALL